MTMNIHTRRKVVHDSSQYAIHEAYFITICTLKKICYFGKVVGDKTGLTDVGRMIEETIININNRFSDSIIKNYVIMPNHIHLILNLTKIANEDICYSISDIIRDFKSYTTREYCKPHGKLLIPLWQSGYYDHRIRDEVEFAAINKYINENPCKWQQDKFYSRY